jgi:hypothetical protein
LENLLMVVSLALYIHPLSFQRGLISPKDGLRRAAQVRDGYRAQDTPAGAPVGAPIRTAGDASF